MPIKIPVEEVIGAQPPQPGDRPNHESRSAPPTVFTNVVMDIYTGWNVFDFRSDGDVNRDKVISFVPARHPNERQAIPQGRPTMTNHDHAV